MYAEERQRLIADQAREAGRVDVARLAAELDVTPETIRRDLTRLERLGQLKRVHGGAIPLGRSLTEPNVLDRDVMMQAEKERIAKCAVEELSDHATILLDAGTTTRRFADHLPTDRALTVVTSALDIAVALAPRPNLTVLVAGGTVRGITMASVGPWAENVLRDLYVDVAFMATNGVSPEIGLTTPDPTEASTKRAMIVAARRVVLLADHTKVGNDHMVRFANLDAVDTFVTDSGLADELAEDIELAGVRVVRA